MIRTLKTLLICAVISSTTLAETANTNINQQFLSRLQAIQTLSGHFLQRQFDDQNEFLSEQQGRFDIRVPGYIRWETVEPMPQLLISDTRDYWLYDSDLEQVTISSIDNKLQSTPALLFSGDEQKITEKYEISQLNDTIYILKPSFKESLFTAIEVGFAQDQLTHMVLYDQLGQSTQFVFSDTILNQEIPESYFHFAIPEGTDVIYQ